jgi:hypothetical protein
MSKESSAEWTGAWVANRLKGHTEVQAVEILEPQLLRLARNKHGTFLTVTIAEPRVEPSSFEHLLDSSPAIEFVVNIPKESFWTGAAIECASRRSVGWGGLRDLYSAIALPEPCLYVRKEFEFVERGLRQHKTVSSLDRVYDRKYVVRRLGLEDVTVVILNEYELTADHVRTARGRYGPFDAILITDPNGGPTSSARGAAESIGASIYKWGEFLSSLGKR